MKTRIETDTLGDIKVPSDKYWGAQTQRSLTNFKIGSQKMPVQMIREFGLLKKVAALVNAETNALDKEKKNLIIKACDEIINGDLDEHFPLVVWQTGSGTQTNMNVNEVIANRAHVMSGKVLGHDKRLIHPNDDVNRSQSSNDAFPSVMNMAAVRMLKEHTIPKISQLKHALNSKALEFEKIIKVGRTHLMDATPISLGQEFSGYTFMIARGRNELEQSLKHLYELAIGGTAVGTGLNAPENFGNKMAELIAEFTGYPFVSAPNKFESLAAHDAFVIAHGALKSLAVSLMKIANDIRLLGSGPRCGIGELILPANEPGSSIMPGKVNPTQAEALTMVCSQVIGNDTVLAVAGSNGHFELNVFKPVIVRNFLESAELLGDAAESFSSNCIEGLQPNMEKIQRHLDESLMLVTALSPCIGYEKAAQVAKKAHEENKTLKQAAMDLKVISEDEFDRLVKPENMV